MSGEMREAMENMLQHRAKSTSVDRGGWTQEQWIEDAADLMNDLHGSVQSLVNGHVLALLRAVAKDSASDERDLLALPVRTIVAGPEWHDEVYQKSDADEWYSIGSDAPWTSRSLAARGPFLVLRRGEGGAS